MLIENYLEELVSISNQELGRLVGYEELDDDKYALVVDLLDGEFLTIHPVSLSEIKKQLIH